MSASEGNIGPRHVPQIQRAIAGKMAAASRNLTRGINGLPAFRQGEKLEDHLEGFLGRSAYYATADLGGAWKMLADDAASLPKFVPADRYADQAFVVFADPRLHPLSSDVVAVHSMWADRMIDPATGSPWGLIFTVETSDRGDTGIATYDTASADYDALRLAFWILDNPDLVDKKTSDVGPILSKAARRRGKLHTPSLVTVVDLRAAHREAAADVAAAERTYRSRWIVRKHWHRYWVGSGENRRLEPRVVMPYVKGPKDAPLNVTTKVSKW